MTKLFIEDTEVDLSDASIQIDYSIAKIGEIESRSGARSAQIALPKTAKNRLVFENTDDVTSLSVKPYRRLKARLFAEGIDQKILFASLESITDTFNIRIYGENVSFFDLLKGIEISDIDFSDLDYFHVLSEVSSKRGDTDLCIPIIDNHNEVDTLCPENVREIYIQHLPPALSVEYLLQKICSLYGYSLENKIAEKYEYPNRVLCMPFTRDKWIRNTDGRRYESQWTASGYYLDTSGDFDIQFDTLTTPSAYNYFTTTSIASWVDGFGKAHLYLNDNVTFDYTCTLVVNFTPPVINPFFIEVLINNVSVNSITPILVSGNNTITISGTASGSPDALFANGVDVTFRYAGAINHLFVSASLEISNVSISEGKDVITTYASEITAQYVTVSSLYEKTKVSDVLKAYLNMFCGVIQVDEISKVVKIYPFLQIASNVNVGKDWSDKIDLTNDAELEFSFDYGQQNSLDWTNDDTMFVNIPDKIPLSSVGDSIGFINLDDENLEESNEMVKLDYSASEMVTRLDNVRICNVPVWDANGDFTGDCSKRLVFIRYRDTSAENPTTALNYLDGNSNISHSTNIPFTHFIQDGEVYNLGFGDNLIEKWYGDFEQVLDKSKILTINLRLNASDINQLDFTKPVFIKHFNAWFYISQIKGYDPTVTDVTQCELVKLF